MVEVGGLEQSEALGLRGNLFCHLCHDFTRELRQLQTSSRMRRRHRRRPSGGKPSQGCLSTALALQRTIW